MLEEDITVINKLGLHLRAATKLVQLASEFDADIRITCNDQTADAKSIMDVLMLAAIIGSELTINVSGDSREDEEEAMNAILEIIRDKFGEEE